MQLFKRIRNEVRVVCVFYLSDVESICESLQRICGVRQVEV